MLSLSRVPELRLTRHELLHDRLVLEFYELSKLPDSLDPADMLSLWLRLIKADTEEELGAIERLGVDVIGRAVQTVREMQEDAALRHLALCREMAAHDKAHALNVARKEGRAEGERQGRLADARRMKADGLDDGLIARYTGLDPAEVAGL